MSSAADHYLTLNVVPLPHDLEPVLRVGQLVNTTRVELCKCYELAKLDAQDPGRRAEIEAAWAVLSDPEKKRVYDRQMVENAPAGAAASLAPQSALAAGMTHPTAKIPDCPPIPPPAEPPPAETLDDLDDLPEIPPSGLAALEAELRDDKGKRFGLKAKHVNVRLVRIDRTSSLYIYIYGWGTFPMPTVPA